MLNGTKVEISVNEGFEILPADKYTCLITNVNFIEQQKYQSIEKEEVLNYEFTLLDNKEFPLKEGQKMPDMVRGRKLWKRCRPAINSKSWLGKLVKAAYGRKLTDDEKKSFDPESIVNMQVDLMCEQKDSVDGSKTYNNILSFAKCKKELDPTGIKIGDEVIEKKSKSVSKVAPKDEDPFEEDMNKLNKTKS